MTGGRHWAVSRGGAHAPAAARRHGAGGRHAGPLGEALAHIGFLDPAAPKKLMPRLNQLFNRAQLTQEEIHILRGVAKAMLRARRQAARLATFSSTL
jgi:tRNA/rRNA methyltransferase